MEALTGIELETRKISTQSTDILRLKADNIDLKALTTQENEKQQKLKVIAENKYNMNLVQIDNYLPRGKEYRERIIHMEKKLR